MAGQQDKVDEVRGYQLVYDIKVPFGLLLEEAADQGLVLIHNPRTGAEDDLFLGLRVPEGDRQGLGCP